MTIEAADHVLNATASRRSHRFAFRCRLRCRFDSAAGALALARWSQATSRDSWTAQQICTSSRDSFDVLMPVCLRPAFLKSDMFW